MDMNDTDRKLAEKLQEISGDVDYFNLCVIWLTYRKIKPVSVIDLPKDSQSTQPIIQWLEESGVNYLKDSQDEDLLYISHDKEKLEIMRKIFRVKSAKLEQIKCEYFGFPSESAYAYISQMYALPESKRNISAAKPSDIEKNFSDYWKPYVSYMMRLGNEQEDSLVAKLWFDTCSWEIPVIHQKYLEQYEADKLKNAETQRELLNSLEAFQGVSGEDKEILKNVYLRNQDAGWTKVTAENKAAVLDWLKKARIQNESDASDENLIYFTTVKDSIDAFRELNTLQSDEARELRKKYFNITI